MAGLRIGTLAERASTSAATIRYYEGIGLLPRAGRQAGNQRRYGDDDVRRLAFIRRCRDFGFSIEQVRTLMSLGQDRSRSCLEGRALALTHLTAVRAKLHELQVLERNIARFIDVCDATCDGGPAPDCIFLDDLSVTPQRAHSR